jgi:hypothetical protein
MPKAVANILTTDADFLAAERELAKVRAEREALSPQINTIADEKRLDKPLTDRLWALYDQIAKSPPVSLSSAAVKLRLLTDPDIGIEQNEGENDLSSLRQVLTHIEHAGNPAQISGELAKLFRDWLALRERCETAPNDADADRMTRDMAAVERAILGNTAETDDDRQAQLAILTQYAAFDTPYENVDLREDWYRRLVVERITDPAARERQLANSEKRVQHAKDQLAASEPDGRQVAGAPKLAT